MPTITGAALLAVSTTGRRLEGLALLAYSAAFGILSFAVLGLTVVSLPFPYGNNARIGLATVLLLSILQCWRQNVWARLFAGMWYWTLLGASSWILLAWFALSSTLVPVTLPNPLPDGAYVIKNQHLHVKIQRMLGDFPADNYIPFVAAEFLLRDIQFSQERPLMPGQELSNRPILLSLATIPIHAAFHPPSPRFDPLPKFRYVGTRWPDVGILGDDVNYRSFLRLAVAFNATLVLGFVLLLQRFKPPIEMAAIACAVFVSSPYFLGETLFVWPKSMAGFFLIMSALTLLTRRHSYVAGLFAGAAYWAHPYAIVYVGCFSLYLLLRERGDLTLERGLVPFVVTALLVIAPWYMWTRIYLQIPSDLVEQNLFSANLGEAVLARLQNVRRTFLPPPGSWSDADAWARVAITSIMGAVGPLLFVQAALGSIQIARRNLMESILLATLPCIMLISVFGVIGLPALHGMQPLAAVLLVISFWWMHRVFPKKIVVILGCIQILLNIALLIVRANTISASV